MVERPCTHDTNASVNGNIRFGVDSALPNLEYWQTGASVSCVHGLSTIQYQITNHMESFDVFHAGISEVWILWQSFRNCITIFGSAESALLIGRMWMHRTYLKDHCTYSGKWTLRNKALYARYKFLCPLQPQICLLHWFHWFTASIGAFLHSDSYPGCFNMWGQKDVLKEQLYWVSIGWWFGVVEVSFYIQIQRQFWNTVNEDYKLESHSK